MFRIFVIAVITTMAAILETAADAIAATLPPPAADTPRLRVVTSGRLWPPAAHRVTACVSVSARAARWRRPSRAPSWLAWCQQQGVHPEDGVA